MHTRRHASTSREPRWQIRSPAEQEAQRLAPTQRVKAGRLDKAIGTVHRARCVTYMKHIRVPLSLRHTFSAAALGLMPADTTSKRGDLDLSHGRHPFHHPRHDSQAAVRRPCGNEGAYRTPNAALRCAGSSSRSLTCRQHPLQIQYGGRGTDAAYSACEIDHSNQGAVCNVTFDIQETMEPPVFL